MKLDVKITKINNLRKYPTGVFGYTAVHFKLNGEDYYLWTGAPDYEELTYLYKGRCKGQVEHLASCFGIDRDLIRFKKKPMCLKYVDTEHFICGLIKLDLFQSLLK